MKKNTFYWKPPHKLTLCWSKYYIGSNKLVFLYYIMSYYTKCEGQRVWSYVSTYDNTQR